MAKGIIAKETFLLPQERAPKVDATAGVIPRGAMSPANLPSLNLGDRRFSFRGQRKGGPLFNLGPDDQWPANTG